MTQNTQPLATSEVDAFGHHIVVAISMADIFAEPVDAIAFKYAQASYGADRDALRRLGIPEASPELPPPGETISLPGGGDIDATVVLFVGTVPLSHFEYAEIRDFSRRAVAAAVSDSHAVTHLGMTMHGVGAGLDEEEAFTAQLAGLLDALRRNEWPTPLRNVTVFERDAKRADRIARIMHEVLPRKVGEQTRRQLAQASSGIESAGIGSRDKPHIFVAMQFGDETEDLFHYGIQSAVKAAGYLCERIDQATFTGDILAQIKAKIDSASFLVAELTGANPNVYLEVGYAWGRNIRTVLLCKEADQLRFDVKGQKVLLYGSIQQAEQALTKELQALTR